MSAAFLYVVFLRDRHGDQDVHLEFLAPGAAGPGQRERSAWCAEVQAGIVAALGRSGNLAELVVAGDRAPVLGIACPVEDAVHASVQMLRRLESESTAVAS